MGAAATPFPPPPGGVAMSFTGSASRFSCAVPAGFQLNQFDEFEFLIMSRQASLGITNSKAAGNIEVLIPIE